MKKLLFFICLLVSITPVFAAWVKLFPVKSEGATLYYNNSLMSRSGDIAKMWIMYDYSEPKTISGVTFLSTSSLYEYDCSKNTFRFKTSHYYEGNMTNGKILHTENSSIPWQDINPESVSEAHFRVACKKK